MRVAGSKVRLTLAEATPLGDDWAVTYTKGSSPIQDPAGNHAANFSMGYTPVTDTPVTDGRAPQLAELEVMDGDTTVVIYDVAVMNGNTIELTYDEVLDAHSTPAPSDFTVHFQGPYTVLDATGHEDGTGHGMCG